MARNHSPQWLIACVLLLAAAWPLVTGIRIVHRPAAIQNERYPATRPMQGPITQEELKRAETRAAMLVPPDKLKEGFTREELEAIAEAERKLHSTQQSVWQRHQAERIKAAIERRPFGWALIGLGGALMILWSWAGWRLRTAR